VSFFSWGNTKVGRIVFQRMVLSVTGISSTRPTPPIRTTRRVRFGFTRNGNPPVTAESADILTDAGAFWQDMYALVD
jgi:hypothetical protein